MQSKPNRETKLNEYLLYWQKLLGLQKWQINIELTEFKRTDYPQSGDIKVDIKNKTATVLILKTDTGRDSAIILHELIHLILWEYDHYAEQFVPASHRDHYFGLLEETTAALTNILSQIDR